MDTFQDKETRAAFIKSRSQHPDKFDWKKALVPEPLSQEELQQKVGLRLIKLMF